ncbi:PH domain-containing protein [Altererythrobacter sp. MF3-039]|uniref:PH domain-containing protein n=1 Tax=Altererythrobacter sp. MF3-039 TaxID=3252901 RepID=UPI00390C40DE
MDNADLKPLHPDYLKVMRLRAAVLACLLVIIGLVGEFMTDWVPGTLLVPLALAAIVWAWVVPQRRFRRKAFAMGEDRLRIVSGFLFHRDTVVPFGRVQHLDVLAAPLERPWSLATLVLHTAGTHNFSVSLPGLKHDEAVAMREAIRSHIKRELA